MDYFFVYLFCIIFFLSFPFVLVLCVTWLGDHCLRGIKRLISYARHKQPVLPQSIPTPNRHLPTLWSIEIHQYSTAVDTPLATHQPQNIAPEHHRPCGPQQSNSTTNTSPAVHRSQMAAPSASNSTASTSPAVHRSQRTAPSASSTHQSNSTVNTSPAVHRWQTTAPSASSSNPSNDTANTSRAVHPLPTCTNQCNHHMPPFISPLPGRIVYPPCRCGAINVQTNISLQAPQQQISMRYQPHSNNSWTDTPSPIIMETQIMTHIQRPHQSQPQTMTPMRYGSQQSSSGATMPLPTRRSQVMTPEPRERPSTRNFDVTANLSSFIYQNCENGMNIECVVCLEKLQQGEKVMKLPNCTHLYHEKCICRWLSTEPSCPICRSPVEAQLSSRIGHD